MNTGSTPYHLCFEVLGNPLRIGIVKALKEKPTSVGELAEKLGQEQSKVSHSLAALKRCQFVEAKKEGKKTVYSLRKTFLERLEGRDIFEALESHYKEHGKECWRQCK